MKNYLISIGAVILAVGIFFAGQVLAPKPVNPLGGYNPPTQSYAGFIHSFSTSTAIATTDFCSSANVQWLGTSALATGTLPAATTTFAACPGLNNLGASVSGNIINDSTNTVAYSPGTGDVFKCETSGAGTSTVLGTCTASTFTILASSTVNYQVFFDNSSSSLVFLVGNNYK